jgi:hypothetical protein
MSITPGDWNIYEFDADWSGAWGGLSQAEMAAAIDGIANNIATNSGGDWAVEPAVTYGTGTNLVRIRSITHTSGATLTFCGARTNEVKLATNFHGPGGAGAFFGAFWSPGIPALNPTTNINLVSTPFVLQNATNFRVHCVWNLSGAVNGIRCSFAWQGANVWFTTKTKSSAGTSWWNGFLAGPDMFEQTVHNGDTYRSGQFRLGSSDSAATTSHSTIIGQCLNAAGTTRVELTAPRSLSIFQGTNALQDIASPFALSDVWMIRDASDLNTTGVIANNGIKGRIARGALMFGPTIIGNGLRVGPPSNVMVHTNTGVLLGWDEDALTGMTL